MFVEGKFKFQFMTIERAISGELVLLEMNGLKGMFKVGKKQVSIDDVCVFKLKNVARLRQICSARCTEETKSVVECSLASVIPDVKFHICLPLKNGEPFLLLSSEGSKRGFINFLNSNIFTIADYKLMNVNSSKNIIGMRKEKYFVLYSCQEICQIRGDKVKELCSAVSEMVDSFDPFDDI